MGLIAQEVQEHYPDAV
ncbi:MULTISPECIES: hypothetical protein [Limnospira]